MSNEVEHTHVRYVVKYNDRTYEHPLHSNKRYFIKNIADVVNILEYCVVQDMKRGIGKGKNGLYGTDCELYNFHVIRLINDKEDDSDEARYNANQFADLLSKTVERIIADNKLRNT
jgi:hypothetical protein